MASTDAMPVPKKNVAYRVTFPLLDADGDLVTGASSLDSEISKDGGTFTDCTNEATEIATASGMYFLDLTSAEMNADTVALIIKSASAKTTPIVLYPQEGGDIRVDVQTWLGGSMSAPAVTGVPEVSVTHWLGTAAATPTVAGVPEVDVTHFGGSAGTFASGIPAASLTTSAINAVADQVYDEATSGHVASGSFGAVFQPTDAGTAAGGGANTITLRAGAVATDDYYNKQLLKIIAGTGAGQSEYISDYVGSTKVATMAASWAVQPDNTSVYAIGPGGTIPGASAPTAGEVADAVWDEAFSGHTSSGTYGQIVGGEVTRTNTAQTGTTSSITLDASASATNNLYRYHRVEIIAGTGAGEVSYITGYTGSSKVAAVDPAFTVAPDNTSVFVLRKTGLDAATPAQVATSVWGATRASNNTAGTFGEYVNADAVRFAGGATAATNAKNAFDGTGGVTITATWSGNITGNLSGSVGSVTGAVGSVTGAVGSVTGNVGGNVVGSVASVSGAVGSVTGNVGGNVTGSVGSLAAQAKADVNAEVLDVLNTDTFAEPGQEAPGATVSLVKKIGYLYKMLRNKKTQTATTFSLFADDGTTVDQKATVSDAAGTTTSGELGTGP